MRVRRLRASASAAVTLRGVGIGRAVTIRLAADGAIVVCTDRDTSGLEETIGVVDGEVTAM